jgi:hypothetical protein
MGPEASRRGGDLLIVLGAIALFAGLVGFKWYGGSATVSSVAGVDIGAAFSRSGWHAFTTGRWVWLATVLLALVTVAATGAGGEGRLLAAPRALVGALAGASVLLIAYRIVHHQPGNPGSHVAFHAAGAVRGGIWLGLAAATAIVAGACLALVGALVAKPAGGAPVDSAIDG